MKLSRAAIAAIVLSVGVSACGGDSLEPLPLAITVTATPASAAVGDTVVFVANSQGEALIGVDAAYGDGTTESVAIPFGRTARNTFKHVYSSAGSFTATFTTFQNDSTTTSATAAVQIH